ncbi:PREDICTED: endogenous retrovirus group K member 18 Pol protein-like [Pseudopodoces humilis]|uniref:endogenous retrovirus group K member 18 Pol protein-like n=1 Tax=Pseudopodoces humilis TaxID=181119 RepID=UPI0006B81152|nr:PREDICTED: endogenous retrovirus group K member 18 Pol protein-like [Pseudopodoces humilis]
MVLHDIKNIMNCLLSPAEYMLWERQWKKHLKQLSDVYARDANRPNFTLEQLAGEGDFQKPRDQARDLPEAALQDIANAAKISLFTTPDDKVPTHCFTNIKQGATESFIKYIDKLKVAIEKQIETPQAQKELLVKIAMANANQECRAVLQALPLDPEPTIDQMVEACTKHSSASNPPYYLKEQTPVVQAFLLPSDCPDHVPLNPTAMWTQVVGSCKPIVDCSLFCYGERIQRPGMIDTGADVTIIACSEWPDNWELQPVTGMISGIGGMTASMRSKRNIVIEGPEGQMATIRPFLGFLVGVTEKRATPTIPQLTWKQHHPVWVDRWPLSETKLRALEALVEEQLAKGHITESNSPWNSPVFVLCKPGKDRWRLLQDLRKINDVIEEMGPLQPGMPSPSMLPRDWKLAVIDIKDCFFNIPLHPRDAPRFAFLVPSPNRQAPLKRYHWLVLPQGMKNSPTICQWYVAHILSPVRTLFPDAVILHYMDDILVCAADDDYLHWTLQKTIQIIEDTGFEICEDKIQHTCPWTYLGLQIRERTIVPQQLTIKDDPKTLRDLHQLCGSINWIRPLLGVTTEVLAPLFNLLCGSEALDSPRSLTLEAQESITKVQEALSS